MGRQRKATGQQLMRLDAIAKHLDVESRFLDPDFEYEVTAACLDRVAPIVDSLLPCDGERIAKALSNHFHVVFEEVRTPTDVIDLEEKYLRRKREIGFAQLRDEIARPGVDALLFQRLHAREHDRDRWVAVLNLQQTAAKAYWNRFHELAHRVAEPPQKILPFRRHRFEASNPVEALIDAVAAEFAFYEPVFRPLVRRLAMRSRLDFDLVRSIRSRYAPAASLLATVNAVVKHWPAPAAAITAEFRGRVRKPQVDQALRITPQTYSRLAEAAELSFFWNMRVPVDSPIREAYQTGVGHDGFEHLGNWDTSQGTRLASLEVYTSAQPLGNRVYALVSA